MDCWRQLNQEYMIYLLVGSKEYYIKPVSS